MFKFIADFIRKKRAVKDPCLSVVAGFNDEEMWVHWPDRPLGSISWNTLLGVSVEVNDDDSWNETLFWHMTSKDATLTCPNSAEGCRELIERVKKLKGFGHEALEDIATGRGKKTRVLWDHLGRTDSAGE